MLFIVFAFMGGLTVSVAQGEPSLIDPFDMMKDIVKTKKPICLEVDIPLWKEPYGMLAREIRLGFGEKDKEAGWKKQTGPIMNASGVHDLYMVFNGEEGLNLKVRHFWFNRKGPNENDIGNPFNYSSLHASHNIMKHILTFLTALLLAPPAVLAAESPQMGATAPSNSSVPVQRQGSTLYDPAEPYNVNAPLFPVTYSEEQKTAQREAGIALIKDYKDAISQKKSEYRAKPGVYRLPKDMNFAIGQHDAFTLYLPNCEIIMESVEKPLFPLWRVRSFTIVGPVKVDVDPLPCSQGRIVASDYERRRITVDILPGYRTLEAGTKKTEVFYAYSPAGIWLPNPSWSQFEWKGAELSAGGRTVTFSTGHDLTRDYWDRLYSPGNLAALGYWPTWLFILDEVANVTLQDLDFYGGLFCYGNAAETCTMTRVRGRRCPGTNRLYGGGGWQSGTRKGRVTLDSCEFRTSYDDLLDMASSSMAMVWQQTSAREIVVWDNFAHRYQDDEPGSLFEFYEKDFTPITNAKLVAAQRVPDDEAKLWIEPAAELIRTKLKFSAPTGYRAFWRLTFDKDLTLDPGTLVEDVADRQMDLVMRNCVWSDAGVRVMIQGGKRLQLTNNHFVRLAGGLDVKTESWWWQGATVNNVLIADNVFLDCNYGALWGSGSAAISVNSGTVLPIRSFPGRYPNNNIVIRNNRIEGSSAGAILVQNSSNVQITGNACRNLFKLKAPSAAIAVTGSGNLTITGNRVENCPAPAIKTDWINGLQCDGNTASNLGTDGKPVVMVDLSNVRDAKVQNNRVERSRLEAVVRLVNGTHVHISNNAASDAPSVPALVEDEKKQP